MKPSCNFTAMQTVPALLEFVCINLVMQKMSIYFLHILCNLVPSLFYNAGIAASRTLKTQRIPVQSVKLKSLCSEVISSLIK